MLEQVLGGEVQGELVKLGLSVLAVLAGILLNAARAYYVSLRERALAQAGRLGDQRLEVAVRELVMAAEQRLGELGRGMGKSKLALVQRWAAERGLSIDEAMIEAAVYTMNSVASGASPGGRECR